jgi:hypothetical protein
MTIHLRNNAARQPSGASVRSAFWATYLGACNRRSDVDKILGADPIAKALLQAPVMRADASPGGSTVAGWGDELVGSLVYGFMSEIAPLSAASKLFAAGQRFSLAGRESISFPINANVGTPTWVSEDDAIPVINGVFDAAEIGPSRKLSFIVPMTRELWRRGNGRIVFDAIVRETVAGMLDAAVFGDQAASTSTHRGLREGVTPTPGTGTIEGDFATLLQAVVDAGGGGNSAIVLSPREHALAILRFPQSPVPIWASRGLPSGTALAIDLDSFASGMGEIEIMQSQEAVIHMSDVPLPIVSGAPVTADPVRSAFQTASIFIRVILDCAWVSRGDRIAVMEGISWL